MARFQIDDSKLPGLGKALAQAVVDPAVRAGLKNDPSGFLVNAGVDADAIKGLSFQIVEDTGTTLNIVVPAAIDQQKVDADDQQYLIEMGKSVTLNCTF